MKIVINKWEVGKTSNGTEKAVADFTTSEGEEKQGVTFWKSNWPTFDSIKIDTQLEGDYTEKQNGQWINKTFYPLKAEKPTRGPSNMTKVMDKKAEHIKEAQENKGQGIKISSTFRMAVECAIAEYQKDNNSDPLDKLISKWRKILWFEYDKWNEFPPFI